MSLSSPGQGHSPWLAALPVKDWPLDTLLRSGDSHVPVALVPIKVGFIPMKNPKLIQLELQKASSLFRKITEVRQFGRGGILCCSADQDCVRELLNCSEFAAQPGEKCAAASAAATGASTRELSNPAATTSSRASASSSFDGPKGKCLANAVAFARGGVREKHATDALGYMIAHDDLPLSTPEKDGFKAFLKALQPLY
ncbi:uncharacterized protein LOC142761754 [Rhipicephalus microplus]|uniref:uncharacterized protein LOC142761754 n=1 Tax=Rhipicephalus microplus TaxID=6941 RepID=UPI003F6C28EB